MDLKAHTDNKWYWENLIPLYHQYIGHINKKINKEIQELNDTIDQMHLIDIYKIFHPTTAFFSASHGTFSKIDILEHKARLGKYKDIEITPCILSDHNAIKLKFNNKKTAGNIQITHCSISMGHRRTKRGNQKVPGS
jgi:hypothetical protein